MKNKEFLMVLKAENIMLKTLAVLAGTAALMSCSRLVYEDEGICDDTVEVYLKYDYNIQRADMRADHVGWAQVYAIDQNGNVADVKTVAAPEVNDKNSTVRFEGLQPGRYTFSAIALQRPYDECAAGAKARFRAKLLQRGGKISDLEVKLDRASAPDADDLYAVDAPSVGLDTLWMGGSITPGGIEVPVYEQQRGLVHRDTVSLVRDTKYLNITLHQTDNPAAIRDNQFSLRIVDRNGYIGHDNELKEDVALLYTPFAQWTTGLSEGGVTYYSAEQIDKAPADDPIQETMAHYDLSFSRLMYNAPSLKNAQLQIVNNADGKVVVDINLPYYLSFCRQAYALENYGEQEYLDREYNYTMHFFLTRGGWEFTVNVMAWARRFQVEKF